MSFLPAPIEPVRPAPLTRVAPVTLIAVGVFWLVAVVLSPGVRVQLAFAITACVVVVMLSGLPLRRLAGRVAPLGVAALGLGLLTVVASPVNADLSVASVGQLGPLRITGPAVEAGLAIALRLVVIALVSVVVLWTSEPTRLVDSLVQQWRLPYRFAYGTLAALRVLPLLAADWAAVSAVRRLRGLEPAGPRARVAEFGDRLLVLLVAALRRADRMALAMDARGFDSDLPRHPYRPVRVGPLDVVVLAAGIAIGLAIPALLGG